MGKWKNFSENYQQFGHAASEKFASPPVGHRCVCRRKEQTNEEGNMERKKSETKICFVPIFTLLGFIPSSISLLPLFLFFKLIIIFCICFSCLIDSLFFPTPSVKLWQIATIYVFQ